MIKKVISAVIIRLLSPINKVVKRTNWYKNVIPEYGKFPIESWYRENIQRNYDIVNVGSSSALYAFNYNDLPVKAFNWAMQPQSMEYSFKILKMFHSILSRNAVVIIPFSPFSGLSVLGKWAETQNDKYYGILDYTLIENYDKVRRRRSYPFIFNPKTSIKRVIKDEKKKVFPSCNICNGKEEFYKDAKRWINDWMKEFGITDLCAPLSEDNLIGRKERLNLLREMIHFCEERQYRPVIVMPPLHPSLNEEMSSVFVENYILSFIRELSTDNVTFLDYMNNKKFSDDTLFYNSFFLNEKGAKLFTKQVLADLNI